MAGGRQSLLTDAAAPEAPEPTLPRLIGEWTPIARPALPTPAEPVSSAAPTAPAAPTPPAAAQPAATQTAGAPVAQAGHRPVRLSQCRVLCVVRPATGGMRQHVIHLARFGAMAGPKFSLAAPPDFLNDLPDDIPVYEKLPLDIQPKLDLQADWRAAQWLRKIAPAYNVVHAQGLRAGFIAALGLFGTETPLVVTAHNQIGSRLLERLAAAFIAWRASRVIAVSQAVAEAFQRVRAPRGRVTIISNGIDLPYFRGYGMYDRPTLQGAPRRGTGPQRGSRASARLQGRFKYQLPQQAAIIGYLGRLSPEKGVDVLLQAAAELPSCLFVIAGDGPERAALEAKATPNVRFLGRIDGPASILAALDVVVIPSRSEGQGIVALEAMASGVPIVASEVGGLKEMLREGDNALLVRPGDTRGIVNAISTYLADPALRDRIVARAGVDVEEHYDVRRMTVHIIGVYQSAMHAIPVRA